MTAKVKGKAAATCMLKQPFESVVLFVPYSATLALATGRPSEFKTAPTSDVAGWQGTNAQQPVRAMHMAAGMKSEKSDRIFYDAQRLSSGAAGARSAEGTGKRSLPAVPWNERLGLGWTIALGPNDAER